MKYEMTDRRTRATSNDKNKWLECDECKGIVPMIYQSVDGKQICPNCNEQNEKIDSLEEELWEMSQENKKLKHELIHYLGELKLHYSRPDSKQFCENKINILKNS